MPRVARRRRKRRRVEIAIHHGASRVARVNRARVINRAPPPLAPIARAASDPAALTDYVTDTKDMIARQRSLLRVGDGDLDAYVAKADAYFAGYKARLYTGSHTTASAW